MLERSLVELTGENFPESKEPLHLHPFFASHISKIVKVSHPYIHMFYTYCNKEIFGEGSSSDVHKALETSIYEAMERYFAMRYEDQVLIYDSRQNLREAIDVRELILMKEWEYVNAHYSYVRYNDELKLHWCRCYEIRNMKLIPRLIPATLAILRYSWKYRNERFAPTLSPGAASGDNYSKALLHGLYELVERDAFMMTWLNRLSCEKIVVDEFLSEELTSSLRRLIEDGYKVEFVNITTEFKIPVILALISQGEIKLSTTNYISFGLGSNLNPKKALMRAFSEALEIMVNYYNFDDPGIIRMKNIRTAVDNFDLKNYFEKCSFLTESENECTVNQLPITESVDDVNELETCVSRLVDRGLNVYFADLTPPQLRNAKYCLIRAFVSYLQPHLIEWDCWRLDNPRIYTAPIEMGYRTKPISEDQLNLIQNPFAVMGQFI